MLKKFLSVYLLLSACLYATDYECIELYGDYRVVIEGTKNTANQVSTKRYSSYKSCNRDLENYLNGKKTPIAYEGAAAWDYHSSGSHFLPVAQM